MTDKWQCCMCKQTKVATISNIKEESEKVKCCYRRMRNLTESQYVKEATINDSGARS